DRLTVTGVESLSPARCRIIPDRIEAGTYLLAIAASGGEGRVSHCQPAHFAPL
ncbi:MAG TPA: UDP-N-acetylglucosamine 1-carboxyvinyltransferase, partial [Desulfobulbaceae bacterium]|nr:UDP-N-acetylglucosamine 1-carboxyvinyltransferase [Desulfobulbaceae bacterium]